MRGCLPLLMGKMPVNDKGEREQDVTQCGLQAACVIVMTQKNCQ